MKNPTVADLTPGLQTSGVFLVQSKDVKQKRTGDPYLALVLMDKTGEIDAKMWDNVADVVDTFGKDDFIKVRGEAGLYNNRLQFTVHRLQRIEEREVDLADFLPASRRDAAEMDAELKALVGSIGNVHLRALLDAIFADAAVAEAYRRAPAAKGIHHAFLGGLLEHVLSLCRLAEFMALHYSWIDRDLLLTGVLLHDIGKIRELGYQRSFTYTTEGQLLGHMQIALRLVGDKLAHLPQFPVRLRDLVEHMILSHHGKLEYGSPKVPLFPEALLLHHLDNLDSKMETMRASISRDKALPSEFTGWNQALERPVLDLEKYFREAAPAAQAPATPPHAVPQQAPAAEAPAGRESRRSGQATLFGSALKNALGEEGS
jgi:3'-5' exoribonuclease